MRKDICPDQEWLADPAENEELYTGRKGGTILAAMIINNILGSLIIGSVM